MSGVGTVMTATSNASDVAGVVDRMVPTGRQRTHDRVVCHVGHVRSSSAQRRDLPAVDVEARYIVADLD